MNTHTAAVLNDMQIYSLLLSTLLFLLLCTLLFFSLYLLTMSINMFVKQLLLGGSAGVFQPCGSNMFLAIFAISYCSMFAKQLLLFCQIFPLLSSPLFCRWWNCPSPYIIWNMSWWSRTYEELGIITSRPYITFSIMCYDALMLQVHDQMMSDMFLGTLLLLLLIFWYIIVL